MLPGIQFVKLTQETYQGSEDFTQVTHRGSEGLYDVEALFESFISSQEASTT